MLGAAAVAAIGAAAGCTTRSSPSAQPAGTDTNGPTSSPALSTSPTSTLPTTDAGSASADSQHDVSLVTAAISAEHATLESCRQTRAKYPRLAADVDPLMATLAAHVRVFTATLPSGTSLEPRRHGRSPGSPEAARAELTSAVTDLARGRLADCEAAESGALASLFASAAASHQAILATWAAG
jgi:hypothetical protein